MDSDLKNSVLKTGTTILSIVCKDGVVMASDRQVTAGNTIVNKDFPKTSRVNDYLIVSVCGNASDAQRLLKLLAAELKIKELKSRTRPSVKQAANLLATISYSGIRQPTMIPNIVGTIIGGFNEDGSVEAYSIEPAGSIHKIEDYDANFGSGMPYVLGFLEREYKKNISVKEGVEFAKESLKASTQRDVGSGYGLDVFVITKEGIEKVVSEKINPKYESE